MDSSLQQLAEAGYKAWQRDRPGLIAVDTETTGVEFFDTAFCAQIAWDKDDQDFEGHYFELVDFDSSEMVREILDETPVWVGHNLKFDMQKLIQADILERSSVTAARFEDTETLAHLLDGNQRKGLKPLAREHLGVETNEEEELAKVRRKLKLRKEDGYHMLPREVVIPYAIQDVILTLQLFDLFLPQLRRYDDLSGLYEHEKLVTLALLDMEAKGMALDMDYLQSIAKEYRMNYVKSELIIRDLTHEEFLPSSWQQVLAEMHDRGHKVPNTQSDTLGPLDDELAQEIVKLRSLKNRRNYMDAMLLEQRDGIIHPNFRQHGTTTGRMSSGEAEA